MRPQLDGDAVVRGVYAAFRVSETQQGLAAMRAKLSALGLSYDWAETGTA